MNTCKKPEEYIDAIVKPVQMCCKRYGYLPSILIAQSYIENGAGIPGWWDNPQIALLMKYNNMVGIKSDLLSDSWKDKTVWPGKSLTKQTPEYYGGKKVTITDSFRIYDNIEQSFADFLLFMKYGAYKVGGKPKYGDAVLSIKDPATLIKKVNTLGYATSQEYANHVMKVVRQWDLTKYDDLTGVGPTKYTPGYREGSSEKKYDAVESISINKQYITTNNSYSTNDPQAIVIHNTDNFNTGADAKAHAGWLASDTNTGMSWHYAVDDHSIYQCLSHNRGAYHVGKNYGSNNLFDKYGGRKKNTIGIEMCVNKGYDYEKAFQNTVALTKYLMKKLNIPADRVYQHYDICSKDCPSQIRKRGDWARFKSLIGGTSPAVDPDPSPAPARTLIRKGDRGDDVKKLQTMLIACGYNCGSAGADGIFGNGTFAALTSFQTAKKLAADGIYGPASKAALEAAYKAKTAKEKESAKSSEQAPSGKIVKVQADTTMIMAVKVVADMAREGKWVYGDSGTRIPCADKKISCDRLPARAMYNMGFHDQKDGGEVCGTLDKYLADHGWIKVTDRKKILPGAIVAVRKKSHSYIDHVFVVVSYDKEKDVCSKFDTGSNERIQSEQPFNGVRLVEWSDRVFVCAWNCPSWLSSAKPGKYVYDGVDYSAVFNSGYYWRMYPDLKEALGVNKKKLFEHFIKNGMKEGRQAYAGFNPYAYRDRYPDLKKAFGHDLPKYYKHFCEFGQAEGRIGT